MSYQPIEHKIVLSSLNLRPPGDQLPDAGALDLKNFDVSQIGSLRLRRGSANVAFGLAALGPAHTLVTTRTTTGVLNFCGITTALYRTDTGASIDTGLDGKPLGIMAAAGFTWVMNRSKQRKYNGASMFNWTQTAPGAIVSATPGAGGALAAGDYEYYVTYDTDDSHETNPSPVTVVTAAAGDKVVITRPASTETSVVTRWHVYRKSPNLSTAYRVNENPILYATNPYTDTGDSANQQSDDDLTARNLALEGNHDPAPAARGCLPRPYMGRAVVWNSSSHPNRIWYSPTNQPWFFPGSANDLAGNWLDIGERFEEVVNCVQRPNYLIIYKQNSIWRHSGDFGEGKLEMIVPDLGLLGYNAVSSTNEGDFFAGKEGIYFFNGDFCSKISPELDKLFRAETVGISAAVSITPVSDTSRDWNAMAVCNSRVYFAHASGNATYPDRMFVYDRETKQWAIDTRGYQSLHYEGQSGRLLGAGAVIGEVDQLELNWDDGSTGIVASYQSSYDDQGHPDIQKSYADLVISHKLKSATTATVKVYIDNGTEYTLGSLVGTGSRARTVLKVVDGSGNPLVGRNISVRIEYTAPAGYTVPAEIFSPIILHYYMLSRLGLRFDSQIINHGTEEVKSIDRLEIDCDAPSGTTLQIYSDLPGGTMAARLGGGQAVASTTGRQVLTVAFATPIEGRLLQYVLTHATVPFIVYGIRARVRGIGVYLEGSITNMKFTHLEVTP